MNNEPIDIVPVEPTPTIREAYKELNKNQQRFLAERHNFKSASATLKALGMSVSTLTAWRKQPAFRTAEDALMEQLTSGILNAENRDDFLYKILAGKAEARLNEILSISIREDMSGAVMNQVRQASEKVLEATGMLKQRGSNGNVAVVVQNFIKGGDSRPSWVSES